MIRKSSTLADFINVVKRHPSSKLVFVDNGTKIKPSYHVTEIKTAIVKSIDCGRRQTEWTETIIQLLDGSEYETATHMSTTKFEAIVKASLQAVPELPDAALYFEYAPKNSPMKKYNVAGFEVKGDQLVVTLNALNATCKPKTWYLDTATERGAHETCCGSSSSQCCSS